MKNENALASSGTIEGLTGLLNKCFYTQSIRIEGSEVFNSKGKIEGVEVRQKGRKYWAVVRAKVSGQG